MFFGLRYVLILPLAVRFQHLLVELMGCYWFLYMIFHVQPTVTDLLVGISVLLLSPRSLCRMSTVLLVALMGIPVPLLLYCLNWYMWLETGTGNANFIYFYVFGLLPCLLCYYLHRLFFGNREKTNGTAIDKSPNGETEKIH